MANIHLRNQFILTVVLSIQHYAISCLQPHFTGLLYESRLTHILQVLKVHLTGICLAHLELGHSDNTSIEPLCPVV